MKRFCTVLLVFSLIIASFVVPSFAVDSYVPAIVPYLPSSDITVDSVVSNGLLTGGNLSNRFEYVVSDVDSPSYLFFVSGATSGYVLYVVFKSSCYFCFVGTADSSPITSVVRKQAYNSSSDYVSLRLYGGYLYNLNPSIPVYDSVESGFEAVLDYINNPHPSYTKNAHVDEFLANTLISMGFQFESASQAFSVASQAWDWCIEEENATRNGIQSWDIDTFVSYCNE